MGVNLSRIFWASLSLLVVCTQNVSAQDGSAKAAEHVVQALYNNVLLAGPNIVVYQSKEILQKYFDQKLVKLFLREVSCTEKNTLNPGWPCTDWVYPVLNRMQDSDNLSVVVGKLTQPEHEILVTVIDTPKKKSVKKQYVKMTYMMKLTSSGWRIGNIRYSNNETLVDALNKGFNKYGNK